MFKLILISCLNAQTYAKSYLIEMQETKNSTDYQGKDLKSLSCFIVKFQFGGRQGFRALDKNREYRTYSDEF